MSSTVRGSVAAGFESVRAEFAAVADAEGGDYAAQLAAYHHGERVVNSLMRSTASRVIGSLPSYGQVVGHAVGAVLDRVSGEPEAPALIAPLAALARQLQRTIGTR